MMWTNAAAMASVVLIVLATGCASTSETKKIQAKDVVQNPVITVVSRSEWGANPPVAGMKRHEITRITIHHTGTPQKLDRTLEQKMKALQQFSQNEGKLGSGKIKPAWPDVPYHYYIDASGRVAEGRQLEFVGDTNTEYDPSGHALVVLEGNFENEQPSPEQLASLQKVVQWLAERFHVAPELVQAHNDYAKTACPGRNLKALLPGIRAGLRDQAS